MRIKVFYKLMLSFLIGIVRHAYSTQRNKYAEVDILHAVKYVSLLQVDTIVFDGVGQACLEYPGKFAMSVTS